MNAKKLRPLQDFADSVYERISINPTEKRLTQIIFYRIRKAFQTLNLSKEKINPNSLITELLTEAELKSNWKQIEIELGLELPKLVSLDFNQNLDTHVKILGFRTFKRTQPVKKGTIRQLIGWTISLNFDKTIDIKKIADKYEVERIISGIISDRMRIPINEIELKHIMTNDLGID